MQNGIAAAWILITLPFVGVVFAFIRMHHAVYNAETPTKKNQLMVLQLLVCPFFLRFASVRWDW